MGLRKRHVKKGNPSVHNSVLFGIIEKAESTDQMINSKSSSLATSNFKTRSITRTAVLEAEYRKAQAIALTRQMHYM